MFRIHAIVFLSGVAVLLPGKAYAYLDPGTGSALLSTVLALLGAALYSFKSLYYRVFSKDEAVHMRADENTLVIFSEGKSYWGTFRPIVNELIKRKIHFRYISLDLHDPALTIANEYMHSQLYLKGEWSFYKLASIKTPVMLSTTPNIGSQGYPMRKSPDVQKLVHVFHAVSDTSHYRLGALDFYDSVIMVGPHQEETLRKIESIRQIQEKELVALGLPYLDDLYAHMPQHETTETADKKTILVAPSWGKKGCFSEYGVGFVKDLVAAGFEIIIRLHPQSYTYEPNNVAAWQMQLMECENVIWDKALFAHDVMDKSDVLISDTSSVRFDYAFLYSKPVITLDIHRDNQDEFESRYQETTWSERSAPLIGEIVKAEGIQDLTGVVHRVLDAQTASGIDEFRNKTIMNFGESAPHIVDYLLDKLGASTMGVETEHA